jgi:O-antigen/teichoic acid export membrane protein
MPNVHGDNWLPPVMSRTGSVVGGIGSARRDAAGSVVTGVVGQIALLASGIIAARSLGVHDRGYLAVLVLVPVVITLVGSLGIPAAIPYFVARQPSNRAQVIRAVLPLTAAQLLILTTAHVGLSWTLVTPHDRAETLALIISLLFVPGMLINQLGLALLQGDRNFRAFNLIRVAPTIANAVVVAVLWLTGTASLVTITGTLVVLTLLGGVWALRAARPRWQPKTSTEPTVRDLASFGIRGFVGSSSPSETFRLDQVFVAGFLSTASLGLYVTASAFTNLVRLVAQSVGMVAYPAVASVADLVSGRRMVWLHVIWVGTLTSVIAMLLVPAMPWLLPFLFGDPFAPAVMPAQVLVVGSVFLGVRRVLGDALRGLGLPGPSSMAELTTWITLLALLPIFATQAGILGVAIALAISWAIGLGALLLSQHVLISRIRTAESTE